MTDRELLQQALDVFEELDGIDTETECVTIDVGDLIKAIRAHLAQPEQEQRLAFICKSCECVYADKPVTQCDCMPCKNEFYQAYIYATPPQRQPLTDEQIEDIRQKIFSTGNPYCPVDNQAMRKAARAIEAAHNIKETK